MASSSQFQWSNQMVKKLINFMKEYKIAMEFKNVDLNADVVALYSCIREKLADEFPDEFGPV